MSAGSLIRKALEIGDKNLVKWGEEGRAKEQEMIDVRKGMWKDR